MKIISKIITVIVLGIFMSTPFESQAWNVSNFSYEIEEVRDEITVCVSLAPLGLGMEICYTWVIGEDGCQSSCSAKLEEFNSIETLESKLEKAGNSTYLVLYGFDELLNGEVLIDKKGTRINETWRTVPGKYTIKEGKLTVPLTKR